jgi:hypothetical protein
MSSALTIYVYNKGVKQLLQTEISLLFRTRECTPSKYLKTTLLTGNEYVTDLLKTGDVKY